MPRGALRNNKSQQYFDSDTMVKDTQGDFIMPEWAGWMLFIMIICVMGSQKDYSGVINELSSKVEELEEKINELESAVEDLES